MIIRYGGFSFNDHEAMVTFFGAARVYSERNQPTMLRKQMRIEGEIVASTPTAINTRAQQIRDGFALDGGVCTMYQSDGTTATAFTIGESGSMAGCHIVQPPSFALQDGKAHFATGLPFSVVLEAEYLLLDADGLVSYSETITKLGDGGPRRLVIELDNGSPQEQYVSTNTPITVVQAGEAVGYLGNPTINSPVFSTDYLDRPDGIQIARGAPQLSGDRFINYPARWAYRFVLPADTSIPLPTAR